MFNTGINVLLQNKEKGGVEKYVFGSFDNRDMAYRRIFALWKNRAPEEVWAKGNRSLFSGEASESQNEILQSQLSQNEQQYLSS